MTRTSVLLLALLILSNAAWLVFSGDDPSPAPDPRAIWDYRRGPLVLRRAWVEALAGGRESEDGRRARDEMLYALEFGEPEDVRAVLEALRSCSDFELDWTPFRPWIIRCLDSDDEILRLAALGALSASGLSDTDLPLLHRLARDRDGHVRGRIPSALVSASGRELTAETVAVFLRLLNDENPGVVLAALLPLDRVRTLTDSLRSRVLELAAEPGPGPRQLVALDLVADRPEKTVREVAVLLAALDVPYWMLRSAAFRGLSTGVPAEEKRRVADEVIRRLGAHACDGHLRGAMKILVHCGTAADIPELRRIAADLPDPDCELILNRLEDLPAE